MSQHSATQTPPDAVGTPCPSKRELQGLIHGDLAPDETDRLCDHVGGCPGCQDRMDTLATAETPQLPEAVRHIDRHAPPKQSQLWKAIDRVVVEVTRTSTVKALTPDLDDDLRFLTPTDKPGRIGTFGEFEIVRLIGRGGMGVVLHGFDPCLQRDVAIKVLDPDLSNNKTAHQRFCREARAAAAVTHENIVTVHQVNEDERSGLPYLVMQLVNGESLEQRLRRQSKLSVPEVVRLGAQAAAGLAAAHAHGLIHRDIKPGNILIEGGDRLKLTDFGLARAAEDMKLTKTGYVSGTPLYMAPEQARGDEADARADLFSLGVVLYEALAGKPPFEGNTPLAVLRRVADDPHPRLRRLNPDVPGWLEDVVDGLLAKEPKDRVQSAVEVAEVLAAHAPHAANGECDPAAAEPCPLAGPKSLSGIARRRHRRKMAVLVTLPFVTGIALGVIAAMGFGATSDSPSNTGSGSLPVVPPPVVVSERPLDEPWKVFRTDSGGAVWSVDACPDGKTLAVGFEDGTIRLFDIQTEQVITTLAAHSGPVWCIDFLPEGKQFISASDDGFVKRWEVGHPKPLKEWEQSSAVRAVAVSPNGLYLAIGERSGAVQIVNLTDEKQTKLFRHSGSVTAVAFSIEGMTVAASGTDRTVSVWDIPRGEQLFKLDRHKGPVYAVAFSQCGNHIATAGWDKTVRVWSAKDGSEERVLTGHEYDVWSIAFDERNGCEGHLASASSDGTVRLWDPESGKQLQKIVAHKPVAHVVRFSTDGSKLISGGRDGAVRMWEVKK
jgi:serine/threonine protein kinase